MGTSWDSVRKVAEMRVEVKLEELGLTLPEPPKVPPGVQVSFAWSGLWGLNRLDREGDHR
jgi:hypothetical protein